MSTMSIAVPCASFLVDVKISLTDSNNVTPTLEEHFTIDSSPMSLDVNYVSEQTAQNRSSYLYTGTHDHGRLQTLNDTGAMVSLLTALHEAKQRCDIYLTAAMNPSMKTETANFPVDDIAMSFDADQKDEEDQEKAPVEKKPRMKEVSS